MRTQRDIIKASKAVALAALGEDLGEANEPTVAQKVMASPVTSKDKEITLTYNVTIEIEGQDRPAVVADWIARQFFA